MKFRLLSISAALCFLAACGGYPDFATQPSDCHAIRITHNNNQLTLCKDTAWYVDNNGSPLFYADNGKTEALLNTLADMSIQGISTYNPEKGFQYKVEILNSSNKVSKTLEFNPIAQSPNLVGSCNGSESYIVGIPGLSISPSINFNPDPDYWKNLALLEIFAPNISKISVTDFINPEQSFFISTNLDTFVIKNYKNEPQSIPQSNIRQWIGALGSFHAAEYCQVASLPDSLKIYQVATTTKTGYESKITFYKKYLSDESPDFNRMYFSTLDATGTAKYFDFDLLLIGIDKLR